MIPTIALSAAPNSWPLLIHVCIGVLAATAMGLTVGALTGRTLERLLGPTGA
jgi:putative Ca2+/H+ antiporter (TMEM165/GDT1 family)